MTTMTVHGVTVRALPTAYLLAGYLMMALTTALVAFPMRVSILGYWELHRSGDSRLYIVYGIGRHLHGGPANHHKNLEPLYTYINSQNVIGAALDHVTSTGASSESRPREGMPTSAICCGSKSQCTHYPYRFSPFMEGLILRIVYLSILGVLIVFLGYALCRVWFFQGVILHTDTWLVQSNDVAFSNVTSTVL